jgi:hypothetical protein
MEAQTEFLAKSTTGGDSEATTPVLAIVVRDTSGPSGRIVGGGDFDGPTVVVAPRQV